MTPKEKAVDLLNKFRLFNGTYMDGDDEPKNSYKIKRVDAKACALICVEEIIKADPYYFYPGRKVMNHKDHSTIEYWQSVKTEIESL